MNSTGILTLFSSLLSQEAGKEGTTGLNLETKADSSAPENKSGAEIVASVVKSEPVTTKTEPAPVKTDVDNPVPAFKAPVSNRFFLLSFSLMCLKAI